ncbi:MAG: glycosyltransferase family 39 protein [Candidatus Omnitrophota bacterium]
MLVLAVYLVLALPGINQPVTDDEIYEIQNAEKLVAGESIQVFVPPLYDCVLTACIRTLGTSPWVFRVPGILSAVLTLLLLFLIGRTIFPGQGGVPAMLSALILAASPAFIQGSLLVHIDNTILVPLILLWLYFVFMYCREGSIVYLSLSGAFFVIALLAKFSTPVIIFPATLYYVHKRRRELFFPYFLILLLSACAFFALWMLAARVMGLSFWQPFVGALERWDINMANIGLRSLAKSILALGIWFSPYLLLGVIMRTRRIWRGFLDDEDDISLFSLSACLFLVYLVISIVGYGFPKYYIPVLPMAILVLVGYLFKNGEEQVPVLKQVTLGAVFMFAYFLIFTKDPAYIYRYSLREVLITGSGGPELTKTILMQLAVYTFPLVVFAVSRMLKGRSYLFKNYSFHAFILVLMFSYGASLSVKQLYADYQTNYSYGEKGTLELDRYLKENAKTRDRVLATKDVLYRLGRKGSYLSVAFWKDKGAVLRTLQERRTRFLVVSVPSQSGMFYKKILLSPEARSILEKNFNRKEVGTYTVYERK